MKSIRTVQQQIEETYSGHEKPKHRVGDRMRVYCGRDEGHHFTIKDIRFNHDSGKFEYLHACPFFGGWRQEGTIVAAGSRQGWHYDSQGYCDNPGRGY